MQSLDVFAPLVQIRLKDAGKGWVPFAPRDEQADLLVALEEGDSVAVCKARQIGVSTAIMVYVLWRFVRAAHAGEPLGIMVVAHRTDTAEALYRMVYNAWKRLPAHIKPPLTHHQTGYLETASGAFVRFETAGAYGGPARGETIHVAWISEYAFCKDQDGLKSALVNAVPTERGEGQIIIESTPNHHGDGLHRELIAIRSRELSGGEWGSNLRAIFFAWVNHAEYAIDGPQFPLDGMDDEELRLLALGASHANIRFRRIRLGMGLSPDKFRRDFPITIDDAYSQGESSYYKESAFKHLNVVEGGDNDPARRGRVVVLDPYRDDDAYSLGADTASGSGRNFSVAYVLSKMTGNPVAIIRSNTLVPTAFAAEVVRLIQMYRVGVALVEQNHSGYGVNQAIVDAGFGLRIWLGIDGKPWTTSQTNRQRIFDEGRDHIMSGQADTLDDRLVDELRSLTIDEKDRVVQPEDEHGAHCDSVVAFGLAVIALREVRIPSRRAGPRDHNDRDVWMADDGTLMVTRNMGPGPSAGYARSNYALDPRGAR